MIRYIQKLKEAYNMNTILEIEIYVNIMESRKIRQKH